MLNFKKSYLRVNPGDPQILFIGLVSGKGPPCVVKFRKELVGALIGNLDALRFCKIRHFCLNPHESIDFVTDMYFF
jgi:hypothetical protein